MEVIINKFFNFTIFFSEQALREFFISYKTQVLINKIKNYLMQGGKAREVRVLRVVLAILTILYITTITEAEKRDSQKATIVESYIKISLYFIQNDGQVDEKVKFYERGAGHSIYFSTEGVYIVLGKKEEARSKKDTDPSEPNPSESKRPEYVILKPVNGKTSEIVAEEMFSGRVNYFIGNDRKKWKIDIPIDDKVRYKDDFGNSIAITSNSNVYVTG